MRSTFIKAAWLATTLMMSPVWADEASPVGLWKNIDDVSGKPKALIRITEDHGVLQGKLEQLFRAPDQEQHPVCSKCDGVNKDKPLLGLTFMWGLKKDGNEYTGGEILDPDNGKVYKSKLEVLEGGEKLQVRGYLGVPFIGRSQTWIRQH